MPVNIKKDIFGLLHQNLPLKNIILHLGYKKDIENNNSASSCHTGLPWQKEIIKYTESINFSTFIFIKSWSNPVS
jgi:hypothetical protein